MDMLEYTPVPEVDRPAEKVLDLPAGRQSATSHRSNSNAENPRKTSVLLNPKVTSNLLNDCHSKTFEARPACGRQVCLLLQISPIWKCFFYLKLPILFLMMCYRGRK
jgi:hypothetical protein